MELGTTERKLVRKNSSVLKGNSHDTARDENGFWKLKRPFPNVLSVYKKCFVQF